MQINAKLMQINANQSVQTWESSILGIVNLTSHVKSLVANDTSKYADLQKQFDGVKKDIDTFRTDMNSIVNNTTSHFVTDEDIQELVGDIKESFQMFIDATPRPTMDMSKIEDLEKRLKALESKKDDTNDDSVRIPKLNLKLKKKM